MNGRAGLVASTLRVRRAGRVVLDGVSLDARPAHVTALCGRSGAGKSTLLRALVRLVEIERGCVTLDGVPINYLPPTLLRRQVGLVAQQPVMLAGSVADNVRHGLPALDAQELARVLVEAGLDATFAQRPAAELSGGERARVAIARALARRPRFLLLDEPTAALDDATAASLADRWREVARRGVGMVIATHDLELAARVADTVLTLEAEATR